MKLSEKIRFSVPIVSLAKRLELVPEGDVCVCPFHEGGEKTLRLIATENRFQCDSCSANGFQIELVEKVKAISSPGDRLIAKVFGGASMWEKTEGLLAIGQRNIEFALETLETHRIPIVGKDVGGYQGRKVIFNTGDGSVLMRRQRSMRVGPEK